MDTVVPVSKFRKSVLKCQNEQAQDSYDSRKSGKTWKKLFTQGKIWILPDLRENSGKIFLIQIFISHDHFALTFVV